jgi:hypothetical protein
VIERSYDVSLMKQALGSCPTDRNEGINCNDWLANHRNVMLVDGDDVGLGTFEYPGVYNIHWFFVSRGRGAIDAAKRLLTEFFNNYDVQTVRGLTPTSHAYAGARWLGRKIGLTSYGEVTYPNGEECELFIMTKNEFEKGQENG